jgi:hypothetical protein
MRCDRAGALVGEMRQIEVSEPVQARDGIGVGGGEHIMSAGTFVTGQIEHGPVQVAQHIGKRPDDLSVLAPAIELLDLGHRDAQVL